jgi:hypothetical protein
MATATYIALANTTLSSATSSVTFSSIPATYRDLVLVVNGSITDDDRFGLLQFNADTGNNYNYVYVANTSSGAQTSKSGSEWMYGIGQMAATIQIMDYSATDKHKTVLVRNAAGTALVYMYAGRWANTNAINSIKLLTTTTGYSPSSTFTSGTTFSLYGIVS